MTERKQSSASGSVGACRVGAVGTATGSGGCVGVVATIHRAMGGRDEGMRMARPGRGVYMCLRSGGAAACECFVSLGRMGEGGVTAGKA